MNQESLEWHYFNMPILSLWGIDQLPLFTKSVPEERSAFLRQLTGLQYLGLQTRTFNSLKRAGVQTIEELLDLTEAQLFDIKNFGIESKNDLQERIGLAFLQLSEDIGVEPNYVSLDANNSASKFTTVTEVFENFSSINNAEELAILENHNYPLNRMPAQLKSLVTNLFCFAGVQRKIHRNSLSAVALEEISWRKFHEYSRQMGLDEKVILKEIAKGIESYLISQKLIPLEIAYSEEIQFFLALNSFTEFREKFDLLARKFGKLSERDSRILVRRLIWAHPQLPTLQELGDAHGVSRERIRQIASVTKHFPVMKSDDFSIGSRLLSIAIISKSAREFEQTLKNSSLFVEGLQSIEQVKSLFLNFAGESSLQRWHSILESWTHTSNNDLDLRKRISKLRNKDGIIRLSDMRLTLADDYEAGVSLLSELFPMGIRSNQIFLARHHGQTTPFESSLIRQMHVDESLSHSEIAQGVIRCSRNRGSELSKYESDVTNLITLLLENAHQNGGIESFKLKSPLTEVDSKIVKIFQLHGSDAIHRSEFLNLADTVGLRLTSTAFYFSYNPLIRAHGEGMISLVGLKVSKSELDKLAATARESLFESEYFGAWDSGKFKLTIKPNITLLAGGVITPPSNIRRVLSGRNLTPKCSCGQLVTSQIIRTSNETFILGFQSLFAHGMTRHFFTKDSTFKFIVDFESNTVELIH